MILGYKPCQNQRLRTMSPWRLPITAAYLVSGAHFNVGPVRLFCISLRKHPTTCWVIFRDCNLCSVLKGSVNENFVHKGTTNIFVQVSVSAKTCTNYTRNKHTLKEPEEAIGWKCCKSRGLGSGERPKTSGQLRSERTIKWPNSFTAAADEVQLCTVPFSVSNRNWMLGFQSRLSVDIQK